VISGEARFGSAYKLPFGIVFTAFGAVLLYLGSLFLLSRQSALELKEVAKLLVGRAERSASTVVG